MFPIKFPVALLFFALGISAAPVLRPQRIAQREDWSPTIFSPKLGDRWCTGSTVVVSWDPSNPPPQVTDPNGTLILGYFLPGGKGGENLDYDHPLASGFPLKQGHISITVPSVTPRSTYIVALEGTSANISGEFSILDCDEE